MKQPFVIVVLAVLTLGSFWLMRSLEQSLEQAAANAEVRKIATAYEVSGRYFGADNRLKYAIHSDSISEFSQQAGMQINTPTVRVLDTEHQPAELGKLGEQDELGEQGEQPLAWYGHAESAWLSADKNVLELNGDAVIISSPDSKDAIQVSSQQMVYRDNTSEVVGETPVRISGSGMLQTAQQFRLDIRQKNVTFDGAVRARYAPHLSSAANEEITQ